MSDTNIEWQEWQRAKAAAKTLWESYGTIAWDQVTEDGQEMLINLAATMLREEEGVTPSEDQEIVRLDHERGELTDALQGVPDDDPEAKLWGMSRVEEYGITSAEWRRPLPAWAQPNLPLVVSIAGKLWVLFDDRLYRQEMEPGVQTRTAYQLEALAVYFGVPVHVVLDADGLHA